MAIYDKETILFKNLSIYLEDAIIPSGYLIAVNGKIASYGPIEQLNMETMNHVQIFSFPKGYKMIPGFIDIHTHGAKNAEVMDAKIDSLKVMATTLPEEGTTSFLATTMTQNEKEIDHALATVTLYMEQEEQTGKAEILGVHLEGPFITASKAGAQPLDAIKKPDLTLFKKWEKIASDHIKLVTLAPEEDHALLLISYLKEKNIVSSMGHTDALYEEVVMGIQAGISHVTHLYNAMRGLHHRDPGVVGAALLYQELMVEMIVDGFHIHPEIVKLTFQQKGRDGIILITDSMRAKWVDDGISSLGGQKVIVKNGKALLENGLLAGSTLKMIDGVHNMMNYTGCTLEDAIRMACYNPAKQLGILEKKGSIKPNKDADLVVLNTSNEVIMTICKGKIAFNRSEAYL